MYVDPQDPHSDTEHMEIDPDYTSHDSLHDPNEALPLNCTRWRIQLTHTHTATVLKNFSFIHDFATQ